MRLSLSGIPSREVLSAPWDHHPFSFLSLPPQETAPSVALLSSPALVMVGLLVAWVGSGLLIALALGRRGHDRRSLGAVGFLLGPLMLGWARSSLIPRESHASPIELAAGAALGGSKRALIVMLGAPDDVADAVPVIRTLGGDLGEVVMIRPISFENAAEPVWDDATQAAATALRDGASFLTDLQPRLLLVPGSIDRVIQSFLDREEVHLTVAVGGAADLAAVCLQAGPESRTVVVAAPKKSDPTIPSSR